MKTADHKNLEPRLVETRMKMMLETSVWCQPIWALSMSWSRPAPWTLYNFSLPRPGWVKQSGGHEPTVAHFAWQSNNRYSSLLCPKPCLCVSIRHLWTEARFRQQFEAPTFYSYGPAHMELPQISSCNIILSFLSSTKQIWRWESPIVRTDQCKHFFWTVAKF